MNRIRTVVAAALIAVLAALAPVVVHSATSATQVQAGPGGCCP